MAHIVKRGDSWFAQVRRTGHKSMSKTFPKKTQAQEWAREIEQEMDAAKFQDARIISDLPFSKLIDRYTEEIGSKKKFGKNKTAVLAQLRQNLGAVAMGDLTAERLTRYVHARQAGGAGGVTIAIDLTYIGGVLKTAKQLWKMPVDPTITAAARADMHYAGLSTKSIERDRRPTLAELDALCQHFTAKGTRQKVPMVDLIQFAVTTAMRIGEIVNLRWGDLNEADRTILIRDRKHPQEKIGNDQEVPLLGEAFDIVKRQPRIDDDDRIFPVQASTVSSIFPRACQALDIADLRFHDLRHEGISRLFEQGYRIEQVSLVSGHRDIKMLFRYVQLRAKDLHR